VQFSADKELFCSAEPQIRRTPHGLLNKVANEAVDLKSGPFKNYNHVRNLAGAN
jgi:hypothetical protein